MSADLDRAMRVIVCDAQAMFNDAFSFLLQRRGHRVVARCRDVSEVLDFASRSPDGAAVADIVISGLDFPDVSGDLAIGKMRAALPEVPIAILSGEIDHYQLRAAVDAGADGVAMRTDSADEVERLLLRLVFPPFETPGDKVAHEKAWSRRSRALADQAPRSCSERQPTPKELEIIRQLVRGESTTRIAQLMGVRTATVRTHLQHLFIKSGTHSRLELVAFAVRAGLVDGHNQYSSGEGCGARR